MLELCKGSPATRKTVKKRWQCDNVTMGNSIPPKEGFWPKRKGLRTLWNGFLYQLNIFRRQMSLFYPFRGGCRKGTMSPFFIVFLQQGFPKGRVQKKSEKVWSFAKLPSDPLPPGLVIFPTKKIDPQFFFLEIRPLLGETNFTLGPISKSILFLLL